MEDPKYPRHIKGVELLKSCDPYKTIYYFDSKYHIVKNEWLTEIPSDEAETLLITKKYALWNLGNPPGELPDTCPEIVFATIPLDCSTEYFLATLFHIKYRESITNSITKN